MLNLFFNKKEMDEFFSKFRVNKNLLQVCIGFYLNSFKINHGWSETCERFEYISFIVCFLLLITIMFPLFFIYEYVYVILILIHLLPFCKLTKQRINKLFAQRSNIIFCIYLLIIILLIVIDFYLITLFNNNSNLSSNNTIILISNLLLSDILVIVTLILACKKIPFVKND